MNEVSSALIGLGGFIFCFSITVWAMSGAQRKRNEKQMDDIANKVADKLKDGE